MVYSCVARPGQGFIHLDGPCQCFFDGPRPEFPVSSGFSYIRNGEIMKKPCPTCFGSTRETTMLVCQTCGVDYGQDPPSIYIPWIVKRTGLTAATCLNLLNSGWSYVEQINEVSRWESPIASLKLKSNKE